jgi:hypothetical protein
MKRFKIVRQRENDALGCQQSYTNTNWYIIRDHHRHHCYCDCDDKLRECKILILFLLSSYFISHSKSKCFPTSLPGFVEFPPTLIFTSCSHAGQKAGTTNFGTRGSLARKNCQGELVRLLRDTKPYFYWRIGYTYR